VIGDLLLAGRYQSSTDFINRVSEKLSWLASQKPKIFKNAFIYKRPPGDVLFEHIVIRAFIYLYKHWFLMKVFAKIYCRGGTT
jgi:hypothetical protein